MSEIQHLHAERLGQHADLRADVAVADDAERLAAHFDAAGGGLRSSRRDGTARSSAECRARA